MRIAVDTLGADASPALLARGALDAAARTPGLGLVFCGDAGILEPLAAGTRHAVRHAPRCLTPADPLRGALRGAVPYSMRAAIGAVADGAADAVVSAGSTAALMAISRHVLGMLPGLRRPAIVKSFARIRGRFRMLDLGANLRVGAAELHQFARMGAAAAIAIDGLAAPAVGLLNIGTERGKGPAEVRAAAELLEADADIRYAGFVEPDRLYSDGPDIVVADGLAGNIALKASEGAARMAQHLLRRELSGASPGALLGRILLRRHLERLRSAYNPQSYNGAALLGVAAVVVKSHGGADREGFASAVVQAANAVAVDLAGKVAAGIRAPPYQSPA